MVVLAHHLAAWKHKTEYRARDNTMKKLANLQQNKENSKLSLKNKISFIDILINKFENKQKNLKLTQNETEHCVVKNRSLNIVCTTPQSPTAGPHTTTLGLLRTASCEPCAGENCGGGMCSEPQHIVSHRTGSFKKGAVVWTKNKTDFFLKWHGNKYSKCAAVKKSQNWHHLKNKTCIQALYR